MSLVNYSLRFASLLGATLITTALHAAAAQQLIFHGVVRSSVLLTIKLLSIE